MNRTQILAWFNLRVAAIAVPLCLIALVITYLSQKVMVTYIGFFILAVGSLIMSISPILIRKGPGVVAFDERDKMIESKTHLIGYCTVYCVFIVTCMVACRWPAGPIILVITLIVVRFVESIATLIQYRLEGTGE